MPPYQRPLFVFVLFNLIGAPVIGRLVWMLMLWLNSGGNQAIAIIVSVLAAIGILSANAVLAARCARAGLPSPGPAILWLITGATFALTIGFGFFSPINLLLGMIGR